MSKEEKEFYRLFDKTMQACCLIDEVQGITCGRDDLPNLVNVYDPVFFKYEDCHAMFDAMQQLINFAKDNHDILPSANDLLNKFLDDDFKAHRVQRKHLMQVDKFIRWIEFHSK